MTYAGRRMVPLSTSARPPVLPIALALCWAGSACNPDQGLSYFNRPPTAVIESHADGDTIPEGYAAPFRGGISDPDNQVVDLWVTWLVDGREACPAAPGDATGVSTCDVIVGPGPHAVTLEVRDLAGQRGFDTVEIVGTPTDAPIAEITEPNPTQTAFYASTPILFEATAADAEDPADALVATWTSSLDGPLALPETPDATGALRGLHNLSQGDHIVVLTVEDRTGKTAQDSVTVRVGPENRPPLCAVTAPQDGAIAAFGATLYLRGTASDHDVPANWLRVTWTSDKDGTLGTSTPNVDGSVLFPWNGLTVNSHAITMTVTDDVGASCSDTIVVTVGTAPLVSIASPQQSRVYPKDATIIFAATVLDNEDPPATLDLEWWSTLDGLISAGRADASGQVAFIRDDLSSGWHDLTLTATDSLGLQTTAAIRFKVNRPPGAAEVAIRPSPPRTTDALVASLDVPSVDPDGDVVSYTYRWYRNDVLATSQTGATVPAVDTAKHQQWRVEVTPTDGDAPGPVATATATIRNSLPVVGTPTIGGGPFTRASTLSCQPGTVQDADGDQVQLAYAWTVDGIDAGVATAQLTAPAFGRDDVVACVVTPSDPEEPGAPATSASVTILNSAPSVAGVSIHPTTPEQDLPITCAWSFTDPDPGDPDESLVVWRVDGTVAGTGPTLPAPHPLGAVITCEVTAFDGTTQGTAASAAATVGPSAPTVTGLSLTPTAPIASDTLRCEVQGFDDPQDDPDQTRYRWTIDGFAVGTGSTLDGAFVKHDVVTCEATPSDGVHDGTPISASVTIRNDPPSAPGLAFDPAAPIEALRDLRCDVATPSTDADDDPMTYTFAWERDGAPYEDAIDAATHSRIPVAALVAGEVWRCSATPDDTEVDGPETTIAIEVLAGITPQVAAGGRHTCLLQADGEIVCWGLNNFGQRTPPAGPFRFLSAGYSHNCAVRADTGAIQCWGSNADGQAPASVAGTFVEVGAGLSHSCGLHDDGAVSCWGVGPQGQATPTAGDYVHVRVGERISCGITSTDTITCWGEYATSVPSGAFTDLDVGANHACAVRTDGTLACWGFNGDNKTVVPATGAPWSDVAANRRYTCALDADGRAVCWGHDGSGQATGAAGPFTEITAGENHACARAAGVVTCWGSNAEGQRTP